LQPDVSLRSGSNGVSNVPMMVRARRWQLPSAGYAPAPGSLRRKLSGRNALGGRALVGKPGLDRPRGGAGPILSWAGITRDRLEAGFLESDERVRRTRALEAVQNHGRRRGDADARAFGKNFLARLEHRTRRGRLHHAIPLDPLGAGDATLARA